MAEGYGRDPRGCRPGSANSRKNMPSSAPLVSGLDNNGDDETCQDRQIVRDARGNRGKQDERQRRSQSNGRGGLGRSGIMNRDGGRTDGNKPRVLDFKMLQHLKELEPSCIAVNLVHSNSGLREVLQLSSTKPDLINPLLNVLAKAFISNSTFENLSRIFTIIKETNFFETAIDYILKMQIEESDGKEERFKQPIKDMLSLMTEVIAKHPTSVTQFVGIHGVLQNVIGTQENSSTGSSSDVDEDILRRFHEFTEIKDKLLNKLKRKRNPTPEDLEREQDIEQDMEEPPPNDFRDIKIFPTTADIQTTDDQYLRANKTKGQYDDLDHYLDVQFRLLREDFVEPLRDGISNYIRTVQETGKDTQKLQDIRIYHDVKIIAPECGDTSLLQVLQFDVSRFGNVCWNKRLIYGSLVCLSPDNFQTFFFATVANSKPEELEKGIVKVQFEVDSIRFPFRELYTMAETTAYFESYRHVLSGLQKIRQGNMPFEKYIVRCENQVSAPAYLTRRHETFDLRPLIDDDIVLQGDSKFEFTILGGRTQAQRNYAFSKMSEPAKAVTVLDKDTWPSADLLHLDESQYKAIHTALTKEFVITQGPPGTGKTYMGLKIVKALLHNRDAWSKHQFTGRQDERPMLIVCYTNHALDQFLEGIVKFFKGDVLRVGGRSQSEELSDKTLQTYRHKFRQARMISKAVYLIRREAKEEMNDVAATINVIGAKIQAASKGILHENVLKKFIGPFHYPLLIQKFKPDAGQFVIGRRFSFLVEWLGLGNIDPFVEMNGTTDAQQAVSGKRGEEEADDDLIDVENGIAALQAEIQFADDDVEDIMMEDIDDEQIHDGFSSLEDLTQKEINEIRVRRRYDGFSFKDVTPKEINEIRVRRVHEMAVALDVDTFADKPKNMADGDWQTQKKSTKKMTRDIQRSLSSTDLMTEAETYTINDIWTLSMADRWRLYRFWIRKYCNYHRDDISENKKDKFECAARRYKEMLMLEDKEIMRRSTVIGMTTTCAAKYRSVLEEIRPRIIVVEEAAEVLEAHIITTLSRGCEHLILIGDHKQLRPNPTVYKLATDYNMNVSLFERMIANGVLCDCLELQHRMRPEISEPMRHIYQNFRDHDNVKKYENIKGISSNMFFINHRFYETHDEDIRSRSNKHEAQYIVGLCNYLLLQGYEPEQITVLTTYSGQLFTLRNLMPEKLFKGVTVTVVDNYQGEENDIVLLSLVRSNREGNIGFLKIDNRVCVALSRAKKGFYVIGNFDLLSSKSKLWKKITTDMRKKKRLGEELELYCQNHPESDRIVVKKASDFDNAPDGGCIKKCNLRLLCGHKCKLFCHVKDLEHEEYKCERECEKLLCSNDHRCTKQCFELCGECMVNVPKTIPRCGHTQQMPCHMQPDSIMCKDKCMDKLACGHECQAYCGSAHTDKCKATIDKTWLCGHKGQTLCYEKNDALCSNPCDTQLACGHMCTRSCENCYQGRLHQPCKESCNKTLICGHECKNRCNLCSPCTRKCENRCNHRKCVKLCGELCAPCKEPCGWRCEHYICGKLCSEPCDRPRCNKPCKKQLSCKHACIGFCGEPCPTDCRICDKQKVTELLFGYEDEPSSHFVLLVDCRDKCIIESRAMDAYMDEKDDKVRGEIMLKCCPKCKSPIRTSHRYGTLINKTLQDIESVKMAVLNSKERLQKLEDDIRRGIVDTTLATKPILRRRLVVIGNPKSENALVAMRNQLTVLKSIRTLESEWKTLLGISDNNASIWENDQNAYELRFLQYFREWVSEKRSIMTSQEIGDATLEVSRSRAHLQLLLHLQKIQETGTVTNPILRAKIKEAERIFMGSKKYTENNRVKVENCLAQLQKVAALSGIGNIADECFTVVRAMSLLKGHWYTCSQGHVYTIGDGDSANLVGCCPEIVNRLLTD